MVAMAAVLSGAIGCPLTSTVLAMELTHNWTVAGPLLAASIAAHGVTVLLQKRSILTERLSRRGHHLSREYAVDPLETVTVGEGMKGRRQQASPTAAQAVHVGDTLRSVAERMALTGHLQLEVVDEEGRSVGEITLADVLLGRQKNRERETLRRR